MFWEKRMSPSSAHSSVHAVEGRQRTRYDRFETEAFMKVRRTCTYIYIWTSIRAITLWSLKALTQRVLDYWAETVFTLWVTVTLTFDLLTPKSIGFFYSIRATALWSLKALAQRVFKFWAETVFTLPVTVTLTFDLLITKSIGVFYSKRAIILWSLKALGQRVLELLSGNEVWQTDRRTRQKHSILGMEEAAKDFCDGRQWNAAMVVKCP